MRAAVVTILLAFVVPCRAQIVVHEFLASNRSGIADRNGYASDWIELHNEGTTVRSLSGHYLTDSEQDLTRWRFPGVAILPKGYVVVYASGKDRRDPRAPLHANFRLSRKGGQILLVAADGKTRLDEVRFDRQQTDVSQGYSQPFRSKVVLAADASGSMFVPTGPADEGRAWRGIEFDDSKWLRGIGGFGFDRKTHPTLTRWIRTDVSRQVRRVSSSVYYRYPMQVERVGDFAAYSLEVRCVAGFVAYVNGFEVARRRAPVDLRFDSRADGELEPRDPSRPDSITIPRGVLRSGKNVLAIHALTNAVEEAREHLVVAKIVGYTAGRSDRTGLRSFDQPTPGGPNGLGFAVIADKPRVEPESGLFHDAMRVTLSGAKGDEIRYTLDGSDPGLGSPIYTAPLSITGTMELNARSFRAGAMRSEVASGVYTERAADLASFDSNLPLFVISTFGRRVRPKEYERVHVHVVDVARGNRCSLRQQPQYSGLGALKTRGSSTLDRPKKGYGLEIRKDDGRDRAVGLLGMPKDSDWVLYGPHNYDQAHIRNAVAYELARRMGLLAPRTRFVEIFVNEERGPVSRADYRGLYLLIERLTPGKHRLDIDIPGPRDVTEPAITGDYLLKIDRPGPGDMGFLGGEQRIQYVCPKEREVTDPQRAWLNHHFDGFARVLATPGFNSREAGYAEWIDVDNFIDYHFFSEFVKNPDAYELSTYFYKRRGEKLRMGPVWDYDRAMRTNDEDYWVGRPSRPFGWTGDTDYGWWGVLFRDPEFRRRYRARSRAFLADELALPKVHALVDSMANEIREAEERDRKRWPIIDAGEWYNEIIDLKQWLRRRSEWLRSEQLEAPEFISKTGKFTPPLTLEMTQTNPGGTLYYTLDGSDPRLNDSSVSPRARVYDGRKFEITANTRVQARALVGRTWSRLTSTAFVNYIPKLSFSEVMFNPEGGRNYEFIEILNHGRETVDLRGLELRGDVRFYFSLGEVRELAPGQRVVVVRDRQLFADRYGVRGIRVAGEYLGRLDNEAGGLELRGPVRELVAKAAYESDWFEGADGNGFSLVAAKPVEDATEKTQWLQSQAIHGSPSR